MEIFIAAMGALTIILPIIAAAILNQHPYSSLWLGFLTCVCALAVVFGGIHLKWVNGEPNAVTTQPSESKVGSTETSEPVDDRRPMNVRGLFAIQKPHLEQSKLAAGEPIDYTYEVVNIGPANCTVKHVKSMLFVGDRLEKVKSRMGDFAMTVVDAEPKIEVFSPNVPQTFSIKWEGPLPEDAYKIITSKTDHSIAISLGVVIEYEDLQGETYRLWRCFRYRYSDNRWRILRDGCGEELVGNAVAPKASSALLTRVRGDFRFDPPTLNRLDEKGFTAVLSMVANGRRVPTMHIIEVGHFAVIAGNAPDPLLDNLEEPAELTPNKAVTIQVEPGHRFDFNLVGTIEDGVLSRINSGDVIIWVLGRVVYDDGMNTNRATQACYSYDRKTGQFVAFDRLTFTGREVE